MEKEDLRYIQKGLGFTIQEMADALNIHRKTYEAWLYGYNSIPEMYLNHLKGMKKAVEYGEQEKLKKYIAGGLIGLGFFVFSLLATDKTPEESNPSYIDAD